jgi:molybdopterin-guanine dinucleotide biosynthesis protein A
VTVSGILLAGGRGERFRGDKRIARVRGVPLLAWAAALLGAVADDVVVVTRDEAGPRGRWHYVRDEVPDRGPLAGILTGLRSIQHPRALVLPVDMPLLTADLLIYLRDAGGEADVTVPRWERLEPVVGVYARACIPHLETSLQQKVDALGDFIQATTLTVRYVGEEEIRRFGDPRRLFFNINYPEDVQTAEDLLRTHGM